MPQTIPGKSYFANKFGARRPYPTGFGDSQILEGEALGKLRHSVPPYFEVCDVVDTASGAVGPVSVEPTHGGAAGFAKLLQRRETRPDGVVVRTHMLPEEWASLDDEAKREAGFYVAPKPKAPAAEPAPKVGK